MKATVLTVSQVNFFLKSLIEGDGRVSHILVCGEISNFTDHYRSGHLYFSLKDEKSVLKAVMFASAACRLKFRPQDGVEGHCARPSFRIRTYRTISNVRGRHAARGGRRPESGF